MLDLLFGFPIGGAREFRVGLLRFFLLMASTLFCNATICGRCMFSIARNVQQEGMPTIFLSSPNLKLSWTTRSSYLVDDNEKHGLPRKMEVTYFLISYLSS